MKPQRQGIYAETIGDLLLFRRRFYFSTSKTPGETKTHLITFSQPPLIAGTPLDRVVSVAVTQTANQVMLFEIHTIRGLFGQGTYTTLAATGQVIENNTVYLHGQIQPMRQGWFIYSMVIFGLMLWISATIISAAVSPLATFLPTIVASITSVIIIGWIYGLMLSDLRRLRHILQAMAES